MKLKSLTILSLAAFGDKVFGSKDSNVKDKHRRSISRVLAKTRQGTPSYILGTFGHLNDIGQRTDTSIRVAATSILENVLIHDFGASGNERMLPNEGKIFTDKKGSKHIRFAQEINDYPVAGGGMVLHAAEDGVVYAINGDFVNGDLIASEPSLESYEAIGSALASFITVTDATSCLDDPTLAVARDADGIGHLAWTCTVQYEIEETGEIQRSETEWVPNPLAGVQRDIIYASTETGILVLRLPQIQGGLAAETRDCDEGFSCTTISSTSSEKISTGDVAIDSAHNFVIDTYNYYFQKHGRDSIDDAGMKLISRVHYGSNYNNAFWDGVQMTYGDGDGVTFIPLSQAADVVAHELTHGVTSYTSNLIYSGESGALNEAMSDIFGAMVEKFIGKSGADIWLLGEDIYTPAIEGDALRDMADPAASNDYDYYPDRYTGSQDNGGVHWNSGIANLAFKLLVTGGIHPRGKSNVNVVGIDFDAAADIFYDANVGCLTPSSTFAQARVCTVQMAGDYVEQVNQAWDAVGVPVPEPVTVITLTSGVTVNGKSGAVGAIQHYELNTAAGSEVTCEITCNNGDADLYVRFGSMAIIDPASAINACSSTSPNSNEACTTSAAQSDTKTYAAVHAYAAYSNLSITCTATGTPPTTTTTTSTTTTPVTTTTSTTTTPVTTTTSTTTIPVTTTTTSTSTTPGTTTTTTSTSTNGNCNGLSEFFLELTTDSEGGDISWRLEDTNGDPIASKPIGTYGDSNTFAESVCIPNSVPGDGVCYKIVIEDLAGDGLCCDNGIGGYKIKLDEDDLWAGSSYFTGSSQTITFGHPPCLFGVQSIGSPM